MLRNRGRPRAQVRLIRAEEAERVSETGAVGSVQEAELTMTTLLVDEIWKPEYLERLARSYWAWLSRATLGLVRVVYTDDSRSAVLLTRRLPLLTFHAPEYETEPGRGVVTWRIARGLLVAREGRDNSGFLQIRVCRPDQQTARQRHRDAAGRPRGAQLLPLAARVGPLRAVRGLDLRSDPAADPRADLQRLSALARAPGAAAVARGVLAGEIETRSESGAV